MLDLNHVTESQSLSAHPDARLNLLFSDWSGHMKSIIIPFKEIRKIQENGWQMDGSAIQGALRVQETEMKVIPDWKTYRCFSSTQDSLFSSVICQLHLADGRPYAGDSRARLHHIQRILDERELAIQAACEFSFYYDADNKHESSNLDWLENWLSDVRCLSGLSISMQQLSHTHQFLIHLESAHLLQAADGFALVRHLLMSRIKERKHFISLMPLPHNDARPQKMRLKLRCSGPGLKSHPLLIQKWAQTMVDHASALSCICNPTINSFRRLEILRRQRQPYYIVHKEAQEQATSIDLYTPDALMNPYLTLTALLATLVPVLDQPTIHKTSNSCTSTIPESLPRSLLEACDALSEDEWIADALGETLFSIWLSHKLEEYQRFEEHIHDWEYQQYFGS